MCVYCFIGDWHFRHDPPWKIDPQEWPTVPSPINPNPFKPWPVDKLKGFEELLRRVKELEDKLGCPCEPNKADYLGMIRERIEKLEATAKKKKKPKKRRKSK